MLPVDPNDIGTQLSHDSGSRNSGDAVIIPDEGFDFSLVRIPKGLSGFVWLQERWSSVSCHALLSNLFVLGPHLESLVDSETNGSESRFELVLRKKNVNVGMEMK